MRYVAWGFIAMCVSHAVREKLRSASDGLRGQLERMGYGA